MLALLSRSMHVLKSRFWFLPTGPLSLVQTDRQLPRLEASCTMDTENLYDISAHPIYLVELLACYISLFLWSGAYPRRNVVAYIDNEATRMALIKAWSTTSLGIVLIQLAIRSNLVWESLLSF